MASHGTSMQPNHYWPYLQEHLKRWETEAHSDSVNQTISGMSEWLTSIGSEFWSAIAGAAVGGVIAFLLQRSALMEARLERTSSAIETRRALAHSLFFKAICIFRWLFVLKEHVEESTVRVPSGGSLASVMKPISNLPDRVVFSSDEMAMLLALGQVEVFNKMLSLDSLHNEIIPVWQQYALLRERFSQLSTAEHFDAKQGAATISYKSGSQVDIALFEVTQVANLLAERAHHDAAVAKDAVTSLQSLLARKLGVRIEIEFES